MVLSQLGHLLVKLLPRAFGLINESLVLLEFTLLVLQVALQLLKLVVYFQLLGEQCLVLLNDVFVVTELVIVLLLQLAHLLVALLLDAGDLGLELGLLLDDRLVVLLGLLRKLLVGRKQVSQLVIFTRLVEEELFELDSELLVFALKSQFLLHEDLHVVLEALGLSKFFKQLVNLILEKLNGLVSGKHLDLDLFRLAQQLNDLLVLVLDLKVESSN